MTIEPVDILVADLFCPYCHEEIHIPYSRNTHTLNLECPRCGKTIQLLVGQDWVAVRRGTGDNIEDVSMPQLDAYLTNLRVRIEQVERVLETMQAQGRETA